MNRTPLRTIRNCGKTVESTVTEFSNNYKEIRQKFLKDGTEYAFAKLNGKQVASAWQIPTGTPGTFNVEHSKCLLDGSNLLVRKWTGDKIPVGKLDVFA